MADKAANTAMDTKVSFQSMQTPRRPDFEMLQRWLDNDYQYWAEPTMPSHCAADVVDRFPERFHEEVPDPVAQGSDELRHPRVNTPQGVY
ncbi:hypothetical protein P43SY_003942 [Pythium insidiosum]|uniref:Uncharacterized protein n=1 Tax=Pythium insidiosum TaxID=114742 RepID=A0AAD5LJB4_PYTIN|nr:hypothetical protein P43SY_003942 [Pythium insidiosum]